MSDNCQANVARRPGLRPDLPCGRPAKREVGGRRLCGTHARREEIRAARAPRPPARTYDRGVLDGRAMELADLAQPLPCGHPRGALVHGAEGTACCCACEAAGRAYAQGATGGRARVIQELRDLGAPLWLVVALTGVRDLTDEERGEHRG